MSQSINYKSGDRVQIKGFAIFGTCLGVWVESGPLKSLDGMMMFADEETGEVKKYKAEKVCKAYEK